MTKPVRLVDAARDEFLAEVAKYGAGFSRAVRAAFKLVARFSEAWAADPKRPGVRRFVMKRYPFVIVYRELAKEIRVLAVRVTLKTEPCRCRDQATAWLLARSEQSIGHTNAILAAAEGGAGCEPRRYSVNPGVVAWAPMRPTLHASALALQNG